MTNRDVIMQIAVELFSQKGFENVGIQEICELSKVSKPTLYYYFGSKNGLLGEIIADYSRELFKDVLTAVHYTGDLPLTVNRIVRAHFKYARRNRYFYRMLLYMVFAPPESNYFKMSNQTLEKEYAILEQLFIKASEDHGNMKNKEKELSATILGLINTYIGMWLNGYRELDEELVFSASHQFMHGIFS